MVAALAPVALLALFGGWAGTVAGGAGAAGAIAGQAALLAVAGWALAAGGLAGPTALDPLRLGRAGRLLPAALWVAAAASLLASPVPRAGRVGVALLPAFLLVPGWVARRWADPRARRIGVAGVAAVVGATAGWSLAGRVLGGAPRAADPIGHHGLLAVWLLALLPVAAVAARRGEPPAVRALGVAAAALATAALVASGSLAGLAGLVVEAAVLATAAVRGRAGGPGAPGGGVLGGRAEAGWGPRRWRAMAGWVALAIAVVTLALVVAGPRLARIAGGDDPSVAARAVYWRGGLRGVAERPWLGWGPGATAWTLAEHLRPVPGVNPPGEVVAELHALPLGLLYELGGTGAAVAAALVLVFLLRRLTGARRRSGVSEPAGESTPESSAAGSPAPGAGGQRNDPAGPSDSGLLVAGLTGLAGAGVGLLATAWIEATALPLALAVAAGVALAGEGGAELAGDGAEELEAAVAEGGSENAEAVASRGGRATETGEVAKTGRVGEGGEAVGAPGSPPGLSPRRFARAVGPAAAAVYLLAAVAALLPSARAHLAYDRSLAAAARDDPAGERRALARAAALDPAFPLYRARLAWSLAAAQPVDGPASGVSPNAAEIDPPPAVPGDGLAPETNDDGATSLDAAPVSSPALPGSGSAPAVSFYPAGHPPDLRPVTEALAAARGAPGIAAFWLTAGVLAADAGAPIAGPALDRACALDPLGGLGPFYRATLDPDDPRAPERAARALLAAPPLGAAVIWEDRRDLLVEAAGRVRGWPGVDAGFRAALAAALAEPAPAGGATARLALRVDPEGAASLPLRAFRRSPRALWLVPVTVHRAAAEALAERFGSAGAAALPGTAPGAFAGPGCGAG